MNYIFTKAHRPAWAWALVILALTLSPGKYIPKANYWGMLSVDKYVHVGIFFIQVILLLYGAKILRIVSGKAYLTYLIIGVTYGIAIEFIQQFIPLRSFELNDMLANTCGAILAVLVFYVGERYFLIRKVSSRRS